MGERSIQTFIGNHIAVYRINKKTFSILKYDHDKQIWSRVIVNPDCNITLGPNIFHPASVKIVINDLGNNVDCIANGSYLKYDDITVPVIQKTSNSAGKFPNSIFAFEFTCADMTTNIHTGYLWTLSPLPEVQVIEPLPRRIAWIIAEDAARNNDDCPITLSPISPITASVTSCYHVFATDAIEEWFQTNNTCPVCKKKTTAVASFIST